MRGTHGLATSTRRLGQMLGWQGLTVALITMVSFSFGVGMLLREFQRPHQTRREVLHSVLSTWMRAPDYLGLNLIDHCVRRLEAPDAENLALVRGALERLGEELEDHDTRFPFITVLGLNLENTGGGRVAAWRPRHVDAIPPTAETETIAIAGTSADAGMKLVATYQVSKPVDAVFRSIERFDDLLLQALIGLSGCSLLCFGYMAMNVTESRERVARESAREATIELADRTCHELGNVAFVVSNERRNLADHIDLLDRFVAKEGEARRLAAERAGIDPSALARFESALAREYETRGIAPDFELARSNRVARQVCRQIAACSDYITLTVRELDGFLKGSIGDAGSVSSGPVAARELFDEAVALLAPRLEAAEAEVERTEGTCVVLADRRLMAHVLVNLIKNALEATSSLADRPRLTLGAGTVGGRVVLTVADNGPGVDRSVARRLFEDGASTKGTGRGRGLAIVRDAVRAQRGEIELVEGGEARGAVFRIALPAAEPGEEEHRHGTRRA